MNLSSPISSVIPVAQGPVLEVLAHTDKSLTGRTVATLLDGRASQRQVNRVLQKLVAAGIVVMIEHGTAHLYQLNREHVAAEAIILLAQLRERLLQRIRENVATWNPAPEAVWLFGSFARGEGGEASDIDLLIIRPTELAETDGDVYSVWERHILDLIECVMAWSGNDCRIVEYTRDEYEALLRSGERLPRDVARDGIRLAGRKVPRRSGVREQ